MIVEVELVLSVVLDNLDDLGGFGNDLEISKHEFQMLFACLYHVEGSWLPRGLHHRLRRCR